MAETPRGIRNNNPGNLEHHESNHWQGEVPDPDGRYARFSSPLYGIRAMAKLLLTYQTQHGCRSIREFIFRWAPVGENDTGEYVMDVAFRMGVNADQFILLAGDTTLRNLVKAMIWHENGQQPYSDAEIDQAIREARE